MNKHFKRGLISMSLWILFVIVVWGSYLYITKRPFSYFIDEETGGFISATFFLSWALIWFGIGQHYSKDYDIKRNIFEQKNQGIDTKDLNLMFRKTYFANFAKTLSSLFFISVPFYLAANVRDLPSLKDCIIICLLMLLSITSYLYYKKNKEEI